MRGHRIARPALWLYALALALALRHPAAAQKGSFVDVKKVLDLENVVAVQFFGLLGWNIISPAVSPDGLTMYFGDEKLDGHGLYDLWQVTRTNAEEPFPIQNARNLGPGVNTGFHDTGPWVSPDGLTIYFCRNLSGVRVLNSYDFDLWRATRNSTAEDFGNEENLGPEINTFFADVTPYLSADGLTLYFSSQSADGHGLFDIWLATRATPDEPFANVENLGTGINSGFFEIGPTISSDELVLFFYSDEGGSLDLWVSTRASKDEPFGRAFPVDDFYPPSDVNSFFHQVDPRISRDWPAAGAKLYFATTEDFTQAIYQATWKPELPPPPGPVFKRGDSDANGNVNLTDAVYTLLALFRGETQPVCADAADADDDGTISITDAVFTLLFLFRSGDPIPPPGPDACDEDPSEDGLTCAEFPPCAPAP